MDGLEDIDDALKVDPKENPFSFAKFAGAKPPSKSAVVSDEDDVDEDDIFKVPKKTKPKKPKAAAATDAKEDKANPFSFKAFLQSADPPTPAAVSIAAPTTSDTTRRKSSAQAAVSLFESDSEDDNSILRPNGSESMKSDPVLPLLPPLSMQLPSVVTGASTSDEEDSDEGEGGSVLLARPPPPVSAVASAPAGPTASSASTEKLQRQIKLLNEQVDGHERQMAVLKERHALEMDALREENARLKEEAEAALSQFRKAEKEAQKAAASLKAKESKERREMEALEAVAAKVEENLRATTERAVAAEQRVQQLQAELSRVQSSLPTHAIQQVRAASAMLDKAASSAENCLKTLFQESQNLVLASEILLTVGQITPLDSKKKT